MAATQIDPGILKVLKDVMREKYPRQLSSETTTEDLGLDSLDLAELAMGLEDEYKMDIPEDLPLSSIGSIQSMLTSRLKQPDLSKTAAFDFNRLFRGLKPKPVAAVKPPMVRASMQRGLTSTQSLSPAPGISLRHGPHPLEAPANQAALQQTARSTSQSSLGATRDPYIPGQTYLAPGIMTPQAPQPTERQKLLDLVGNMGMPVDMMSPRLQRVIKQDISQLGGLGRMPAGIHMGEIW